ncbi:hypothetical protein [uncultured Methylobacterium sp.]|uniref:hypothetical protein n=1 Tax=uncultured Methylobacterium sp. TaxID=157278 RepID=UPI00262A760A|nr:hypothetical protein [uncultured Methylobacterium sp.]
MSDPVRLPPEILGPRTVLAASEDGGETVVLAALCLIIGGAIALLALQVLCLTRIL